MKKIISILFLLAAINCSGQNSISVSNIRTFHAAEVGQTIYLNAGNQSGMFQYIPNSTMIDDSVMVFVNGSGQRWVRMVTDAIYSKWFGPAVNSSNDSWYAMQKAIHFIIAHPGEFSQNLKVSAGYYHFSRPLICANWNAANNRYVFFSINIEGESRFSEASGYGTTWYFDFNNSFGIGFQLAKGASISGIKMIGRWAYQFTNPYDFYNSSLDKFTDGLTKESRYGEPCAIAIDPFGYSLPSDGGYPGLSGWYRGSGKAGSTGIQITDMFLSNWPVGIITSPNGETRNAELIIMDRLQLENMKVGIAGCQDQEKMNKISNVQCWGVVHTLFATGVYGQGTPGNWYVEGVNIAGYTKQIVLNNQGGYFESYFKDIFAESIGSIGTIHSIFGSTFTSCVLNFAPYSECGSYTTGQINGSGATFIGCTLRMYGTYKPITINAVNGMFHFRDCYFDAIPFYPQIYPYGYSDFSNCTIGDGYRILNPLAPQAAQSGAYSSTFAYGPNCPVAAMNLPINTNNQILYKLNRVTKNNYFESTVRFKTDEALRIKLNDVIVASPDLIDYKVAGLVTDISPSGFTISYLPAGMDSSKTYRLYVWLPLMNISFKGDMSAGSDTIKNVILEKGAIQQFINNGGLLYNEYYPGNMVRILKYIGNDVICDRPSKTNGTSILFTQYNTK